MRRQKFEVATRRPDRFDKHSGDRPRYFGRARIAELHNQQYSADKSFFLLDVLDTGRAVARKPSVSDEVRHRVYRRRQDSDKNARFARVDLPQMIVLILIDCTSSKFDLLLLLLDGRVSALWFRALVYMFDNRVFRAE